MTDPPSSRRSMAIVRSMTGMISLVLAEEYALAADSERKDYWFAAVDPVVQNDRKVTDPPDYMELFPARDAVAVWWAIKGL